MTTYLSDKLRAMSFMLMVMVVFIHAYDLKIKFITEKEFIHPGFNFLVQNLINQGFVRIAVPLFFTISGYLFFRNIKNGVLSEFLKKFQKRLKTLLRP